MLTIAVLRASVRPVLLASTHAQGAVARSSLAAKISAYNDANKCPTCQQAVYDGPDQSMVDGKRYHNVSESTDQGRPTHP